MKLSILISLLLLIGAPLKAQTPRSTEWLYELKPASSQLGCEWGYQDEEGNWVIEPQFERAQSFYTDSLAIVSKGGLYGILHYNGYLVLDCKYDFIQKIKKHQPTQFWGGPESIQLGYGHKTNQDGLYQVTGIDSNQSLFNAKTGNWLKLGKKERFKPYLYNGRLVINDRNGQRLASQRKILHKKAYQHLQPITATLWAYRDKNNLHGLLSKNGDEICPALFGTIANYFVNGLLPYFQKGQVGFIDSFGQIVYKAKWDSSEFENSLNRVEWLPLRMHQTARLVAKEPKPTNYFLPTGELLLNHLRDSFETIYQRSDRQVFAIREKGKWSLVNDSLKKLSSYQYDEIMTSQHEYFRREIILRRGDTLDAYKLDAKFPLALEHCFTYPVGATFNFEEYSVLYQGKIYYHAIETNKLILVTETPLTRILYDDGTREGQLMWLSKKNDKYGLLSLNGDEVLAHEFDTIMMGLRNGYRIHGIVVKNQQVYELDPWLNGVERKVNQYNVDRIVLNNTFHAAIDDSNRLVFASRHMIKHLQHEFYFSHSSVYSTLSNRYFSTRISENGFKIINEQIVELSGVLYKRSGEPLFVDYTEIKQHKQDYFYGYNTKRKLCLLNSAGELLVEFPDSIVGFYDFQPKKKRIFLECIKPTKNQRSYQSTFWKLCHFPSLKPLDSLDKYAFSKPFNAGHGVQIIDCKSPNGDGLINKDLEIIHKPRYNQIISQGNCYFLQFHRKDDWWLADSSGHLLLDFPCDELSLVRDSMVVFRHASSTWVYHLSKKPIDIQTIEDDAFLYQIAKLFGRRVPHLSAIRTMIPKLEHRLMWWRYVIDKLAFNCQISDRINEELVNDQIWSHSPIISLYAGYRNLEQFSETGKYFYHYDPKLHNTNGIEELIILGHTKNTLTVRNQLRQNGKLISSHLSTFTFGNKYLLEIEIEDLLDLTEKNKSQLEDMTLSYLAQHPELKLKCSGSGFYFPQLCKSFGITQTEIVLYNVVGSRGAYKNIEWHIPIEEIKPMLKIKI